ncbi:MAG: hypothetical protein R3Y12_02340 [Clostridia bacterium]
MKEKFSITKEQLKAVPFKETGSSMTDFCREINRVVNNENMELFDMKQCLAWFDEKGYLVATGDTAKPTEFGLANGIRLDYRNNEQRGDYVINLYDTTLQQLILDNIDEILKCKY